jgi:hypothetical protein
MLKALFTVFLRKFAQSICQKRDKAGLGAVRRAVRPKRAPLGREKKYQSQNHCDQSLVQLATYIVSVEVLDQEFNGAHDARDRF